MIIIFLYVLFPLLLTAGNIHVDGTYDLDGDGQSEILLLLNKAGGPYLEYTEMDETEGRRTLWAYSPPAHISGRITDARLADLNGDDIPELVATVLTLANTKGGGNPWLYIFEWQGTTFAKNPLVYFDSDLDLGRLRPQNFIPFIYEKEAVLAVALGTPTRKAMIFKPAFENNQARILDVKVFSSNLLSSGYGKVFTGIFREGDRIRLALFSPEANLLKTTIFDLSPGNYGAELLTDVLVLNGARRLFGPGITTVDENNDGNEEILLPFENGEVLSLSLIDGQLSLMPSVIQEKFMIVGTAETMEKEIREIFRSRTQEHKVDTTLSSAIIKTVPVDTLTVMDSLFIGDTLHLSIFADSIDVGKFYSFRWHVKPSTGVIFNPANATIYWQPSSDQAGVHPFVYSYELRTGEKVVRMEDDLGDRHQIVPILEKTNKAFAILVKDTVVVDTAVEAAEEMRPRPIEMFSIMITSPLDSDTNRFIFDGVPPFGVLVREISEIPQRNGKLLGHHISADLASIKEDKQVTFRYTSKKDSTDVTSTVVLIHDLESNLIFLSVSPVLDTIPQSFHPEAWNPEFYRFPEYFFEGFPSTMVMDSVGSNIQFTFGPEKNTTPPGSSIGIISPIQPVHYLTLELEDGILREVRGEVKVKENGTKKIITEVDLAGTFIPKIIRVKLEGEVQDSTDAGDKKVLKALELIDRGPADDVTKPEQPVPVVVEDSTATIETVLDTVPEIIPPAAEMDTANVPVSETTTISEEISADDSSTFSIPKTDSTLLQQPDTESLVPEASSPN